MPFPPRKRLRVPVSSEVWYLTMVIPLAALVVAATAPCAFFQGHQDGAAVVPTLRGKAAKNNADAMLPAEVRLVGDWAIESSELVHGDVSSAGLVVVEMRPEG